MSPPHWSKSDYQSAREFLDHNEGAAARSCLLEAGEGLRIIRPAGFGGMGARFHGLFMLAPLPVFMLCAVLLPVFGFAGSWTLTPWTLAVTAACGGMLWGLGRAWRLVLRQRELFPFKFFTTLSPRGAAMHYSPFHFPFQPSRAALTWQEVDRISTRRAFYPPGLFSGRPWLPVLALQGPGGREVLCPLADEDPKTEARLRTWLTFYQD